MDKDFDEDKTMDDLTSFRDTVKNFENLVDTLLSVPYDSLMHTLSPIERAKMEATTVFGINCAFWAYLRCSGTDLSETQLPGEIQRIQKQFERISEVGQGQKRISVGGGRLDVEASRRMIQHALWQEQSMMEIDGVDDSDTEDDDEDEIGGTYHV